MVRQADRQAGILAELEAIGKQETSINSKLNPNAGRNPPSIKKPLAKPLGQEEGSGGPDRQQEVIDAPADSRLLVLAPPGTGKTWVIIERLLALAKKSENPTNIRMLAFTKAAAHEMLERYRHRIVEIKDAPNFPSFGTLDSFCGDIIQVLNIDTGKDLNAQSHDDSILLLVDIAEGRLGGELKLRFENLIPKLISHLIVDEIQDIVHVRARLILHLARVTGIQGNGMLMAGDLRQAIYNTSDIWTVRGGLPQAQRMDAFAFAEELAGIEGMRRLELTRTWRYKTEQMLQFIGGLQSTMDTPGTWPGHRPDFDAMEQYVRAGLDEIDDPSMLDPNGRVAVLAHSNKSVQEITSRLLKSLAGRMKVRAVSDMEGNGYPGWVGRIMSKMESFDEASFIDCHIRIVEDDPGLARQRWRILDHLTSGKLSIRRLVELFRVRRDMSTDMRESARRGEVIVSTIHKAKGLEFEQVVVFEPNRIKLAKDDGARLLYVALTRGTSSIASCSGESWNQQSTKTFEAKDADMDWFCQPEIQTVLGQRQEQLWRAWTHAEPLQVHHHSIDGAIEVRIDGHPLARWRPKNQDHAVKMTGHLKAMISDMRTILLDRVGQFPFVLVPHIVLEKTHT